MALHGKEISDGTFLVEDVLEAGLPSQTKLPPEPSNLEILASPCMLNFICSFGTRILLAFLFYFHADQ